MILKNDKDRIKRFNEGNFDEAKKRYIFNPFLNEHNIELKNHLKNDFFNHLKNESDEKYDLAFLFDRIYHINIYRESIKENTIIRRIYKGYSIASAVMLIPLLMAGYIWFNSNNPEPIYLEEKPVEYTLFAPLGSRISFNLPDGTEGWLNSGSSLRYSIPFKNDRNVTVLGEAFFDVMKDDNHPFEIFAGSSKLKVLGTKFNLNAYPEENYIEVVLEEGKLSFSASDQSSEIVMNSNNRLIFKNGNIDFHNTEAYKYSAWKEGKMMFRGDPMDEVARRFERWYNVEIELMDNELKNYVFRGTFQDDSLEEALHFISMTSPIKYQIMDRKLLENDSVSKKRILLYMIK